MRRSALAAHHPTFKRQALHRFDRHEREMKAAVHAAIGDWVTGAARKLGAARVLTASAASDAANGPDPTPGAAGPAAYDAAPTFSALMADRTVAVLRAHAHEFAGLLDQHVRPVYERMLDEVLGAGLSDGRIGADLIAWRGQWLERRTQELVQVPDAITGILRTQLRTLAESKGTSVDDAQQTVQRMLDRGYPQWEGRARMIARTEVVGANNQGSLAAWSALAHASGQPATKTWLATEDRKTRTEHADLDGTSVGIEDTFDVGGYSMNGPGDDAGGPEQVINCRCTLTYSFADGEEASDPSAPDADTIDAATEDDSGGGDLVAAANPAQGDEPTGVAIMAVLAQPDSDRLTVEGGAGAVWPGLHCTLGYLKDPAAAMTDEVRASLMDALAPLADLLPVSAEAFATAHFNPDSDEREPCAVLLVQSDGLAELHDGVARAINHMASDAFPIWVPHVAVAYNADPGVIPEDVPGSELTFDRLVVGWGAQHLDVVNPPAPDPGGQTGPQQLTAAQEAPVTAPAAPPADTPAPDAPDAGPDLTPQGTTWEGPLMLLDSPTDDGRVFAAAGMGIRTLPLPLSWQRESGPEHDDSIIVGRILTVEPRGNMLWGTGDYLDPMLNYDAAQAMQQVESGLGMVSADCAVREAGFADANGVAVDPGLIDPSSPLFQVALAWDLGGATIVSFPAFDGVRITNVAPTAPDQQQEVLVPGMDGALAAASPEGPSISDDGASIILGDGSTVGVGDPVAYPDTDGDTDIGTITAIDPDAQTVTVAPQPDDDADVDPPTMVVPVAQLAPASEVPASEPDAAVADLLASSALRPYTAAFFARDEPDAVTPLTYVPETGEVYGHAAQWGVCHVGKLAESGKCVTAPTSAINYADFHQGTVFTDQGLISAGKITVGTGHAQLGLSAAAAVAHYDNTGTQVAVVRAKDGRHGVWMCGQIIHDTPPAKIEEMLRSPLSGDWRARDGQLEMCAALCVNTPGFPLRGAPDRVPTVPSLPTPRFGMLRDQQVSLVAAGVVARPARVVDGRAAIGLPSGATIERDDFEALVAAAADALHRGRTVPEQGPEAEQMAFARARLRLLGV